MTARQQLDGHLVRFVDAAIGGDDAAALVAFADAQGLLEELRVARSEAHLAVAVEREAAQGLPDDLDRETAAARRVLGVPR